MPMKRPPTILVWGLGIVLLAAVGVIVFQSRKLAEFQQQQQADLQSLRQTQEALRQSELGRAAAAAKAHPPARNDQAAIARRDATIKQLDAKLADAQSSISQLQAQLSKAQDNNQEDLASAKQRYQALQADWQKRYDTLQKELNVTKVEVKNSRQRVAALEKANARLASSNNTSSARISEQEQLLKELQDINRRREAHLASIQDRYQDITSRFRTMSGMLSSPRNGNSTGFSGPALDLIQNAISLTENDLQRLSELNAKAFRLEKKLRKK